MADMLQGDDYSLILSVIRGGLPVDLTSNTAIKADLQMGGKSLKVYSLVPESNEGQLYLYPSAPDNNKIELIITREDSVLFPEGHATINILVDFADAKFPNGKTQQYQVTNALIVRKGLSNTVKMP